MMPLFPPVTPVSVTVDGRPLAAYVRAYVAGARVYAPVRPLLTRLADRLWYDGENLVIERDGRRARVRIRAGAFPGQLDGVYVMVGPVLQALGATVRFDAAARRLFVNVSPRAILASPTPFNAAVPSIAPSAIFTPAMPATPRPIWTGSPLPRRTALPVPPPN